MARVAASPAASVSTAARNSMISTASASVPLCPAATPNRIFDGGSATNAPTPWRVVTSPSARNAATASRTTVRLTPMAAIISCSVGRRVPGMSLPSAISAAIRRLVSCTRLRDCRIGAGDGTRVVETAIRRLNSLLRAIRRLAYELVV